MRACLRNCWLFIICCCSSFLFIFYIILFFGWLLAWRVADVDGLHTRAGSKRVLEMHGNLRRIRSMDWVFCQKRPCFEVELHCAQCSFFFQRKTQFTFFLQNLGLVPLTTCALPSFFPISNFRKVDNYEAFDHQDVPTCEACMDRLRPEVVLFEEALPELELAQARAATRKGFDIGFVRHTHQHPSKNKKKGLKKGG